jgi:hypothetical protein
MSLAPRAVFGRNSDGRLIDTTATLDVVYAQVAGPTTPKGQSLGTAARPYSDVRAGAATIGGDAETPVLTLNGLASVNKNLVFSSESFSRWIVRVVADGVGGDLEFVSRNDDGTPRSSSLRLSRSTGVAVFTAPPKIPSYTVATLPLASAYAQCLAYVSDGTSNKRLAVSDGTNWRFPDGAIVS